jgi:hypothetical protein
MAAGYHDTEKGQYEEKSFHASSPFEMSLFEQIQETVFVLLEHVKLIQLTFQFVGLGSIRCCLLKQLVNSPLIGRAEPLLLVRRWFLSVFGSACG